MDRICSGVIQVRHAGWVTVRGALCHPPSICKRLTWCHTGPGFLRTWGEPSCVYVSNCKSYNTFFKPSKALYVLPSWYITPSYTLSYDTPWGCMLKLRLALFRNVTSMTSPASPQITGPASKHNTTQLMCVILTTAENTSILLHFQTKKKST